VDEKTLHKVVKHVPQYVEKEVGVIVEVPEVRHTQELRVEETWIHEEMPYEVTTTRIREVLSPQPVTTTKVLEDEQPLEVVLPVGERIIERPHVKVDEFVTFTRGKEVVVEVPPSIVEVPYAVQVPRVEIVQPVEHETSIKDVVVEHVQETVRVIENVQHQTVEKVVDVPQDYTEITRKYVPYFVQEQIDTREFVDLESLNRSVIDAQAYLMRLEQEKVDLRARLSQAILDLSARRQEMEDARTENRLLEVQTISITGSPRPATKARYIHTPERGTKWAPANMFDVIDANHDGKITRSEWNDAMAGGV